MSQENVESYRRVVAAWNRGNLDAVLAFVDEDVENISRLFIGGQLSRSRGSPSLVAEPAQIVRVSSHDSEAEALEAAALPHRT